jgi:hypothetical protein
MGGLEIFHPLHGIIINFIRHYESNLLSLFTYIIIVSWYFNQSR